MPAKVNTFNDAAANTEPVATSATQSQDVNKLTDLIHQLLSGMISIDTLEQSKLLLNILEKVTLETRKLSSDKTSSWVQYMNMVDVLRMILKAERLGDWDLHLRSPHEMLLATRRVYSWLTKFVKS